MNIRTRVRELEAKNPKFTVAWKDDYDASGNEVGWPKDDQEAVQSVRVGG